MKLHEITSQQYLDILSAGGDAVCTEERIEDSTREHFLLCTTLDKAFGEGLWRSWAVGNYSPYKYFYTVVE